MGAMHSLRAAAQRLKREMRALAIAARDPRTPLPARALAAFVLAYALSPIDLIPDFVPVLGLIDDLVLVPLGLWLALRLIPTVVMEEARAQAREAESLPKNRRAGAIILALWLAGAALCVWLLADWIAARGSASVHVLDLPRPAAIDALGERRLHEFVEIAVEHV
jgi:uncharacterized membrane protein YkvA (DUF1232 family)